MPFFIVVVAVVVIYGRLNLRAESVEVQQKIREKLFSLGT